MRIPGDNYFSGIEIYMYRLKPIRYLYSRNSCFAFHYFKKIGITFEFKIDTAKARQNTITYTWNSKRQKTQNYSNDKSTAI